MKLNTGKCDTCCMALQDVALLLPTILQKESLVKVQ